MFEIIFISCTVALILLIWFHTEAFIEYATLIGGEKFFHIESYKDSQKTKAALTYHGHLLERHNSFFIKLITCEICLSFWLTLAMTLGVLYNNEFMTGTLWVFPICNLLALVIYKITIKLLES